jgi:Membrane domain of glycerophosphoryl diester phosphodiesterase
VWAYRFSIRAQNLVETTPITDTGLSGLASFGPALAEAGVVLIVVLLFGLVAVPLMYGVPVHIAAAGFRAGHVTATDGIRAAVRRYWSLLGTLVLLGLTIFGVVLVITVPLAVLAGIGANSDAGGGLFGVLVLGYLVAWVAAVIVGVRLSLAIPVVMVEQAGPVEALRRSNALVKGKTLMVFATFLVVGIIAMIAVFVLMFGSSAVVNMIIAVADNSVAAVVGGIVAFVLMMFAYLMQYALLASAVVLVYFDRRVRIDGLDLTEMVGELGARDAPG